MNTSNCLFLWHSYFHDPGETLGENKNSCEKVMIGLKELKDSIIQEIQELKDGLREDVEKLMNVSRMITEEIKELHDFGEE